MLHNYWKFPNRNVQIWIRLPRHNWPKSWSSIEDPVVPLERNLFGHPLAGLLWERQFEKILLKYGWEKVSNWDCLFVHREKGLFLFVYVDDIKSAAEKQNIDPMWKLLNKEVDLGEPTSFLDRVYLGCTQRQCELSKDIVDDYRTMFESRISAARTEKTSILREFSYFFMVLWYGRSCEEMCGAILWVGKQDDSTTLQSICSVHRWPPLQRRRNEICWRIVTIMISNCFKMFIPKLVTNAWIDWYLTFITHVNTNNIVMWETLQNNADWDCFKTPILQEILRIQNLRQVSCVLGSHTFVPISWMCKKQTSVSHSSTESEIISLDAGLRFDGVHALDLWDLIVSVLGNTTQNRTERETRCWTNVKFVLHLTRFTNASNLKEWSMIWIMLILFPQTSNLLIRNLCCMCLKTTKQWSRWS